MLGYVWVPGSEGGEPGTPGLLGLKAALTSQGTYQGGYQTFQRTLSPHVPSP